MCCKERRVFAGLGLRVRRHRLGLLAYWLPYRLLLSPVSLTGTRPRSFGVRGVGWAAGALLRPHPRSFAPIAEQASDHAAVSLLRDLGVDMAQACLLGPPMPVAEVLERRPAPPRPAAATGSPVASDGLSRMAGVGAAPTVKSCP